MSWRPSRLLRLAQSRYRDHLVLCEADSEHYDDDVHYMTLSHRGNAQEQVLLRKTNRAELRRGIDTSRLKVSIRDALTIAKHLAIECLWVDTLCIIQDDSSDRSREIAQMDKVYGNSLCNIAASDGVGDDIGCFHQRDKRAIGSHRVRLGQTGSLNTWHLLRLSGGENVDWDLNATILENRAWGKSVRPRTPQSRGTADGYRFW